MFELVNWGRPFFRCMWCFKQWSRRSLMWNAQKSYNNWDIIGSKYCLEMKVLHKVLQMKRKYKTPNSIPYPFTLPPEGIGAHVYNKFLNTINHVCKIRMQNKWWMVYGHAQIQHIVIAHYKLATTVCYVSGQTIPNNSAFLFYRHDWYCSPILRWW